MSIWGHLSAFQSSVDINQSFDSNNSSKDANFRKCLFVGPLL